MRRTLGIQLTALLAGATTAEAQTSLTIYSDGRVLERRTVTARVPAGTSIHRLELGVLDPGSVFPLDSGMVITGATYDAAVDEANSLRRALGRRIVFWTERGRDGVRDTVSAELIGVNPERYRLRDGWVTYARPGVPLFPAELVLAQPALTLGVRSDRARSTLGLGFFSLGASWQATYDVMLGRGMARVHGRATISAGPIQADSAEVQLVAGEVSRPSPKPVPMREMAMARAQAAADPAAEEAIGEVHLYTVPGRLSFLPGLETTTMLFEPASAGYERTYTVRGQLPFWGGLPQYGEETTEPVRVTYVVKHAVRTEFGERPIPGGVARIYERDQGGRPQLVGEASIGHTAPGQDLRLDAGTAFDLTAKRIQSSYSTRRDSLRTVATAGYTVTITSAKDSAVTVDVLEARGGEWSVISSSVPAEKLSSTITRFRVRVPPRGEATLSYRVRVVW